MLLLMMLVGGTGNVWGETATLQISSGVTDNPAILTDNKSNSWTFTTDGTLTSNNSYIQAGTNKSAVSYLKLETSAFSSYKITKVQVWGTSKANTSVTAKVIIGTTTIGTSSAYTTQNASSGGTEFSVDNTDEVSGNLTIEISRPSSANGAIYFCKAIVTYEEIGDNRSSNEIVVTGPTSTELSVGQTTTFTVASDNDDNENDFVVASTETSVATVTGTTGNYTITAVAAGTTTITVNQDASTNYKAAETVSFTITVVPAVVDGTFDFTGALAYGSGLTAKDNIGYGQDYESSSSTWTAGNVTLVVSGKYRWWKANTGNTLRLYSDSNNENGGDGNITISVPSGYVMTGIDVTGTNHNNMTTNVGSYSSSKWEGVAREVIFTFGGSNTIQIKTITVTYAPAATIIISSACTDGEGNYYATFMTSISLCKVK